MKTLLASLFTLVLLGAPRPALALEPGDQFPTMVLCSTPGSVMTVVGAAEISGEKATAEMRNLIGIGVCWLTGGLPVALVEKLHSITDYEGDLVEVWSVEIVEITGRLFYVWLIYPRA